jgi:hypothetical protein
MRKNITKLAGLLAAVALAGGLTGCAGAAQKLAPPPPPPEAVSYPSLGALRDDLAAKGFGCERFEVKEHPFLKLLGDVGYEDGTCWDSKPPMNLTVYTDLDMLQGVIKRETNGSDYEASDLYGPNWEITFSRPEDLEKVRAKLGGTPLKDIKPR